MSERGQVLPLVAVVVVAAGAVCLAAGRLGGAAVDRARAVTAADAAALAGAVAGADAAQALAAANGARLTGFERSGPEARATVALGAARAAARARAVGSAGEVAADLGPAPGLRAALARAAQLLGVPVPLTAVRVGVGEPGPEQEGRHRAGLAVHVPAPFVTRLAAVAAGAGLCRPAPDDHPVHFELCPSRLR